MASPGELEFKIHDFRRILTSAKCLSSRCVHYPRHIQVPVCRFGSCCFTENSVRLVERKKERMKERERERERERKKERKKDEQSVWAAILFCRSGTSGSFAKGIFRIRKTP